MQALKSKRGYLSLGDLPQVVMLLVVAVIFLGVGLTVLGGLVDTLTGEAQRVVNESISSLGTFTNWLPTIVTIVAAAVVIGVIITVFLIRHRE